LCFPTLELFVASHRVSTCGDGADERAGGAGSFTEEGGAAGVGAVVDLEGADFVMRSLTSKMAPRLHSHLDHRSSGVEASGVEGQTAVRGGVRVHSIALSLFDHPQSPSALPAPRVTAH
jgi:hypothetical protein